MRDHVQFDCAAGDPRHVQQIVDEPRHVLDLPFDDRSNPGGDGAVALGEGQQLGGGADRGERRAELVREHGEEFVLPPVCLQRQIGHLLALDRDRRRVREELDDLLFLRRGGTRLPEVGVEGAEHPVGRRDDRHRPRGLESDGEGEMPERRPAGRLVDVLGDDRLAKGRGRRRGPDAGSDSQLVDRFLETGRKSGPAGMTKVLPVRVEQQNGGHGRASGLLFDDAGEDVQNAGKRRAAGDHFERALLSGEQRLTPVARRLAVEHEQSRRFLEGGAPDRRDVQADAHRPLPGPIDQCLVVSRGRPLGDDRRHGGVARRERCPVGADEPQHVVDPGVGPHRLAP